MATVIDGTYTLKEVFQISHQYARNRFEYRKRDVVKRVEVKEVRELKADRRNQPTIKYEIRSKSFPNYPPYFIGKDKRGRTRKYQRTTAHHYDITLEMDRLSLNTKAWRMRVGSGKIWDKKPPQSQIKQVYKENRKRWKRDRIERHKKKARYLDIGDYNANRGINGDFVFKCAYARWYHGHLFGRQYYGNIPAIRMNPQRIVFFTKHEINFIEALMSRGLLKDA